MTEQFVDKFVLDCGIGPYRGGTGKSFDWEVLTGLQEKRNIVLAGGIGPHNVDKAAATGLRILDVNSKLESSPGVKDSALVTELFAKLRVL